MVISGVHFYMPDGLPVAQPTTSKHCKKQHSCTVCRWYILCRLKLLLMYCRTGVVVGRICVRKCCTSAWW